MRMSAARAAMTALGALCLAAVAAGDEPTRLTGRLLDPVDRSGIGGGEVRVGPKRVDTGPDGSFEVRVGRNKRGDLVTAFDAPGHSRYRSWTPAGGELTRDVYLFPTTAVSLPRAEEPVPPDVFEQHFNFLYRDPIWTNPSGRGDGHLQRWMSQPRITVDTRILEERNDPDWHWVAREKVPGKVRRHVRAVIRTMIGPFTGGFLEADRIRFRRMREGEVIAESFDDVYSPGQIRVSFITSGFYNSGGGVRLEGHSIVAGHVTLDVESVLRDIRRDGDYLTAHEFAHALGMMHPMEGSHGFTGTPLCSIMGGCNGIRRPAGVVWKEDRIMARLAHARMPGNDLRDRDPEPGPADVTLPDAARTRFLVFHTPPRLLPPDPSTAVRFAR